MKLQDFLKSKVRSLIVLLYLALVLVGCQEPMNKQLRVGSNLWIGYEPFYVASHYAMLDPSVYRVLELSSASHVAKALEQDLIDVGALTLDEVIKLADHGQDYIVLLVTDYSFGGDVIIAQPHISNWQALKGKRIGLEMGAVGEYVLQRALEINGLDKKDFELIPMYTDQHIRAFDEHRVDALSTFEPARTITLKRGGQLLFDSRQIPQEIIDVVVVKKDRFKALEPLFPALFEAWFNALDRINSSEQKVIELLARRNNVEPEDVPEMLQQVKYPDREENFSMLYSNQPAITGQFLKLQEFLKIYPYADAADIRDRALPPNALVIPDGAEKIQ